jgi:general secretion pathway protein D
MKTTELHPLARWLTAVACCSLVLPALAGGGGGGAGGGGGGRGGGGGGGVGGGGGNANSIYATQGQVGPVTYTIDPISGTVVFITAPENKTNVDIALMALDPPMRQVLIKAVFLEVTYNKGLDIGLEGGITHHLGLSQTLSYSNLFGLAANGLNPTQGINTLPGESILTFTGNDFTADLRAIAEKGKVEVLSRPTILARHAQPASILIGQQVPLITGVNFGTLGQVTSVISYTSVGIQLNVTPFIHPNGYVEMILNPTISEVAAQSTQISTGTNGNFSTPYIDSRSANTVVIVPSGQTVVIGGLMQDSKTTTDSQIPFFGDIPILGNLFKHKETADAKTELMIFVTPFVINTPDDLSRMSVDEVSRGELTPKAFTPRIRDNYIDPLSPSTPGAATPQVALPAPPATVNPGNGR